MQGLAVQAYLTGTSPMERVSITVWIIERYARIDIVAEQPIAVKAVREINRITGHYERCDYRSQ